MALTEFVPKWIAWEVTARCNLSCIHCRSCSAMDSDEGDFTTEEGKALIDDIAAFASPVLVLSGGEPLLREDLFTLARYGTDKGLRMCLATNGTLVTAEVCERIKASGIRIVSLSLDGSTAAVHDDFRRQPGAYDGTLRAAALFREHGIEFLVNSSFTRRNQADIPNVQRLAKEIGAKAWYLFMIVPTGRGEGIMEELIPKEEYETILNWQYDQEQAQEGEEDAILMRPTCAPHYYRIFRQRAKAEGKSSARRSLAFSTGGSKGCLCAQLIAFINSRGDVLPCSYFPVSAGNVKEQPFKAIWEDSELFRSLRDFSSYKGKCGRCEYLQVCGGCRARSHAVHGDYLAEEPYCDYQPRKKPK